MTPVPATSRWVRAAMDGALLAGFMVSASAFTILVEHPASPVRAAVDDPLARRALVGLAMAVTAAVLIYSPWGRRTGALMNPAVTLAFARLGRLGRDEVRAYLTGQFAGGVAGMLVAAFVFGPALSDPTVNWIVTTPGPSGVAAAFAAELLMTMVMMTVVLWVANHPRFGAFAGLAAALLLALFITFEAPFSGMSLNPARSLAPALLAGHFTSLWIYFLAPVIGMTAAAELYRWRAPSACQSCGHHHAPADATQLVSLKGVIA